MVRKKMNSTKKSIFAPPGKVLMIERNRSSGSPQKTPKSSKNSTLISPDASRDKSINSTSVKSQGEVKKRKISQTLKAIREIKKFQSSTSLLIPRAPFSRLVREITYNVTGKNDIRFTALSLMALQEATEMAIVNLLEIANLCCLHAKRVTLTPGDIRLTRRVFGVSNALNS